MFFTHGGCGHNPRGATGRRGRGHWGPFEVSWDVGPGRGEGRTRRRMFDGGELRLVLLKLIADAPRHGYDLIREIEELTHGAYAPSPGIVYPTLTLLEEMDLIAQQPGEGAKKQFAATPAGEAHLAERADEVTALMARLGELGEARSRSDSSSVRRAMGNLRQVLMHKLRDGGDAGQRDAIVALIDEVAQTIERL